MSIFDCSHRYIFWKDFSPVLIVDLITISRSINNVQLQSDAVLLNDCDEGKT